MDNCVFNDCKILSLKNVPYPVQIEKGENSIEVEIKGNNQMVAIRKKEGTVVLIGEGLFPKQSNMASHEIPLIVVKVPSGTSLEINNAKDVSSSALVSFEYVNIKNRETFKVALAGPVTKGIIVNLSDEANVECKSQKAELIINLRNNSTFRCSGKFLKVDADTRDKSSVETEGRVHGVYKANAFTNSYIEHIGGASDVKQKASPNARVNIA